MDFLGLIATRGQRLLDTQVFDAEYYASECGRDFESKRTAVNHFVMFGMKAGLSFHPLFDLGMFPLRVRELYKSGDVESLLIYLRSPQSREHRWSWLFDPSAFFGPADVGSLLLSWFRPGRDREIPVPAKLIGQAPSWLDARALIIAHARNAKQMELGKKPLRHTTWSAVEENAWLASIAGAPTPIQSEPLAISIVMPAWNRSHMIEEAIASVRQQSFESWELIVVDDGSTDGTQDVVRSLAAVDSRIRLIEAAHEGVCAARNRGIDEARGEYLSFLDSDNTWRPNFLKNMHAGLSVKSSLAAYSAIRMVNDRQEYTGQTVTAEKLLVRNYVDLNVLVVQTALVRQIGGFDRSLRRWVDYDLVLRITETATIEYFPFIGCDYIDDQNEDRITRRESGNWEYAVLGKNLQNRFVPDLVTDRPATPAISVLMRVTENIDLAIRNIRQILDAQGTETLELVIMDEVAGFRTSVRLRTALAGVQNIKYLKLPRRYTPAISYNIGSSHASAPILFFLHESVELRAGATRKLVDSFSDPSVLGVQPVISDPVGVVVSSGGVSHQNSLAVPLFKGLTIEEARRHNGRDLDELAVAAFGIRSIDFDRMGRFNHIFAGAAALIDFFRRISSDSTGKFITVREALAVDHAADAFAEEPALVASDAEWLSRSNAPLRTVSSHYSEVGLGVLSFISPRYPRLQPATPILSRISAQPKTEKRLRWAIKIGADFSTGGDRWGDVPYAADLAESLEVMGQEALVDRAGAFSRPSNHLDDVVLVIRGLVRCEPQPGKVNVLWAISRPDQITRDEVVGFDLVFGGSRIWCDYVVSEWGVNAQYLPQATNPRRFYPSADPATRPQYGLTFVGGPRKPIGRKVVADCIQLGRTVNVWGPRWEQFIPVEMVESDFIANDDLAGVYGSSRLVLNDHFEDMARWGFANNRLYDAVASGARVVSDYVDGIADIFHGAVRTYTSLDELEGILADMDGFPDDLQMEVISQRIREEHSFDARAATLIKAVVAHIG